MGRLKSYPLNPYLIASGLSIGESQILNILESDDISATRAALESIGVVFKDHATIVGSSLQQVHHQIDCRESGSTLRMMIPVFMLLSESFIIDGKNQLRFRTLDIYEKLFKEKGLTFEYLEGRHLPLKIKGKLKAGHYLVPGNTSSQFISGLLFALPLLKKDSVIEVEGELESAGYVDLTLDVLKKYGIHILKMDTFYYIKGNQTYQPQHFVIEGDYSQAAFFMVAGVLGGSIVLENLSQKTLQGDAKMIDLLKNMGADIAFKGDKLYIEPSITRGIEIDLKHIPDLGPILMILAALSEGKTTFKHIERLRLKESDRIVAMCDVLTKFGVSYVVDQNTMTIEGQKSLKGYQTFDVFNDHRIVMAIAMGALKAEGPIKIMDAHVVGKSYQTFFEDYQRLGGSIDES